MKTQLNAKVPKRIGDTIAAKAKAAGITRSSYVAAVLAQHVDGGELRLEQQPRGLAGVSKKKLREVRSRLNGGAKRGG